jgi:hypothetical protein
LYEGEKLKKKKVPEIDIEPLSQDNDAEEAREGDEDLLDSIQKSVAAQADEALNFYEQELEPMYVEATDYYMARPFGDEEEGRSKVVSTDLRDTVASQVPSLMRIFLGPTKSVEFRGHGNEDSAVAAQETDYINFIFRKRNPAFITVHGLLKDFLLRKAVVKWFWEDFYRVEEVAYEGLTQDEAAQLQSDPDVEIDVDSIEQSDDAQDEPKYNLRVKKTHRNGCERYVAVPPEELLYTPGARSAAEAPFIGHVRYDAPYDEAYSLLLDLGYDPDEAEELLDGAEGRRRAVGTEQLVHARQNTSNGGHLFPQRDTNALDKSQRPVQLADLYVLVDGDGDKIAERRKFITIGPDWKIVNGDGKGEIVDEVPIAWAVCDPEPHTVEGLNDHDFVSPIQRVKSQIEREQLNSLGKATDSDLAFQNGKVNVPDLLNPDVKGLIRTSGPPAQVLMQLQHTFVGDATLPVLQYYNDKIEATTGRNNGTNAIDADSLQSSTKLAVAATLTASQDRLILIAQTFAELIMKPLFQGLLKLSCEHRNEQDVIRLRGQYVPIDPNTFDPSHDVDVNVGLGQGLPEDRLAVLQAVHGEMKEMYADGVPFVTLTHIRKSLARMLETAGYTNDDDFFDPWGPEQEQAYQQQKSQQQPPPDPAMALVQVEMMKLNLQAEKNQADTQIQIAKLAQDYELRLHEIEAKYKTDLHKHNIDAEVEHVDTFVNAAVAQSQAEKETTDAADSGNAGQ